MTDPEAHYFEDRSDLFQSLANRIAHDLSNAIDKKGQAALAVSGGSTPLPLFQQLSRIPVAWSQIHITLVDERWVQPNNERSNERLVRENLLNNLARDAAFTGLKTDCPTPEEALAKVEDRLRKLPLPFDAVVLGMGDDGHTASFFPNADRLIAALAPEKGRLCEAIRAPGAGEPRITLTLPPILASANLMLLCTGTSKKAVFEKARDQGPVSDMPIRAVLQANTPLSFYWAP